MARQDARDGEGRDPFASATGTFIIHLFNHDSDKCSNMTQYVADKGGEGVKQGSGKPWQTSATMCWVDDVQIKCIVQKLMNRLYHYIIITLVSYVRHIACRLIFPKSPPIISM